MFHLDAQNIGKYSNILHVKYINNARVSIHSEYCKLGNIR